MHERIGRARERYPSVQHYYDINVVLSQDNNIAIAVNWSKNEEKYDNKKPIVGPLFFKDKPLNKDEVMIWNIYNTIREIESSFRTLKTDLDLRPVYHKSDAGTMAHLHLGLLAYWLVNTVRVKLKATWHKQQLAGDNKDRQHPKNNHHTWNKQGRNGHRRKEVFRAWREAKKHSVYPANETQTFY